MLYVLIACVNIEKVLKLRVKTYVVRRPFSGTYNLILYQPHDLSWVHFWAAAAAAYTYEYVGSRPKCGAPSLPPIRHCTHRPNDRRDRQPTGITLRSCIAHWRNKLTGSDPENCWGDSIRVRPSRAQQLARNISERPPRTLVPSFLPSIDVLRETKLGPCVVKGLLHTGLRWVMKERSSKAGVEKRRPRPGDFDPVASVWLHGTGLRTHCCPEEFIGAAAFAVSVV